MPAKWEIGSEFWDVPTVAGASGFDLPDGQPLQLRCGRDALALILEDIASERPLRTIALPSYCCESMIAPAVSMGLSVSFYPVEASDGGGLSFRFDSVRDCDAILVMDYFGYESERSVTASEPTVILDLTHSVFASCTRQFDYAFGSLRKWAGFWGGGFAVKASGPFSAHGPSRFDEAYFSKRRQAMELKRQYIEKGVGEKRAFLALYAEAEGMLESGLISMGHPRDAETLASLDLDLIVHRRRENAQCLLGYVGEHALFPHLKEGDVPLFVPLSLLKRDRDGLRDHLIDNGAFCPVHWPKSELHAAYGADSSLYDREISLVCDQRYGVSDMKRIGELVSGYLESAGCR